MSWECWVDENQGHTLRSSKAGLMVHPVPVGNGMGKEVCNFICDGDKEAYSDHLQGNVAPPLQHIPRESCAVCDSHGVPSTASWYPRYGYMPRHQEAQVLGVVQALSHL